MSQRITQELRVKQYLERYGSITTWEAIKEFGATRLSAIIYNLRHKGMNIKTKYVTGKNRFGDNVTFARYYIPETLF